MTRNQYVLFGVSKGVAFLLCVSLFFLAANAVFSEEAPEEGLSEASRLMTERWQIRHDAEYDNPEIARLRVETKQLEKDLLELRRQFAAHMRAHYPEIRAMEKAVREAFALVNKLREEEDVTLREQRLSERGVAVPSPVDSGAMAGLSERVEGATKAANEARTTLEARRKELGASDEAASVMLDEIHLLEIEYGESFARMNRQIDALPEVRKHDADRVGRMSSIQNAQEQKQDPADGSGRF